MVCWTSAGYLWHAIRCAVCFAVLLDDFCCGRRTSSTTILWLSGLRPGQTHNLAIDVQIEYSLLKRDCEKNGTLDMCKQLGVTPVAHSPLKQGLLSDFAKEREDKEAEKLRPFLKLVEFVGAINGNRSVEQCALNYLLCRGAVAIPGVKSVAQLNRNAGAMGWRLDDNEVEIFTEKLESMGL